MEFLTPLLEDFAKVLPNMVKAILILIIGWIIAAVVANVIKKLLKSIGIDKLGEKLNQIDMIEKANLKVVLSTIFSKAIYYLLILFFMVFAAGILDVQTITEPLINFIYYIPKLVVALIIVMGGLLFGNFIKGIVETGAKSVGIPSASLIGNLVFYFILINVVLVALNHAEIGTDFVASNISIIIGGVVLTFAIGYGFASRSIMASVLASFYSKDKFREGDVIKIGDVKGEIDQIDSTSCIIKSEGKRVVIPMSQLLNEKVEIHD